MIHVIEDIENRSEITMDKFGNIVSTRDSDGTLHENIGITTKSFSAESAQIKETVTTGSLVTDSLTISTDGLTDLQKALKANGLTGGTGDWTDESYIQIPIPRTLARVNIIADKLPTTKTDDIPGYLEFWDMTGNYFKKPIIINAQGNSSMGYPIKNLSFDFEDGTEVKFGHWVAQDSFHLKAFYIDVFVGIANAAYNYIESVYKANRLRPSDNMFHTYDKTDYQSSSIGKPKQDFNTGALCHPEGFPIELYFNGEYYALFAWNLKKHRANYLMDKKDFKTIHLDGMMLSGTFWSGEDNIKWTGS